MAAASAVLSPQREGSSFVPVTQRGFVVRREARGIDARVIESPSTARDVPESGLLSALGSFPRRTAPALAVATPPGGSLDIGAADGVSAGELRLVQCATLTPGAKQLIRGVVRGLKAWQEPEAASEGFGGTYFFKDERGACRAIMKPCDEEPLAPNNPKGFVGRQLGDPGLKPTVRVGEAAAREVAAYLLDRGHFHRVPHTVMVEMTHPVFHVVERQQGGDANDNHVLTTVAKLGSLQEYVPHDCDTSEMGASRFSVADVHRIGILDIRLFNTDRHAGNILVRRRDSAAVSNTGGGSTGVAGTHDGGAVNNNNNNLDTTTTATFLGRHENAYELVPIDHGFALPEELEPPYFEWQHWPQAMMPFSAEELEYIASLDARADAAMLRRELPCLREESLRLLEVSTLLLQRCAAAGMSLAEIAGVVTRPIIGIDEEVSELEKICYAARREVEQVLRKNDDDSGPKTPKTTTKDKESGLGNDDDDDEEEFFYEDDVDDDSEYAAEDDDQHKVTTADENSTGIESMWVRGEAASLFALGLAESLDEDESHGSPSADQRIKPVPSKELTLRDLFPASSPDLTPRTRSLDVHGEQDAPKVVAVVNDRNTHINAALRIITPSNPKTLRTDSLFLSGKALPGTPVAVVSSDATAAFASPADTLSAVSSLSLPLSSAPSMTATNSSPEGSTTAVGHKQSFAFSSGQTVSSTASSSASTPLGSPLPIGATSCAPVGAGGGFLSRYKPAVKPRRRRGAPSRRARASRLQPLVHSENAGSSSTEGKDGSPEPNPTSSAVFRGLSQDEWEYFMHLVRQRIRESVNSGAWRQGPKPGAKNMPGMSCPRF